MSIIEVQLSLGFFLVILKCGHILKARRHLLLWYNLVWDMTTIYTVRKQNQKPFISQNYVSHCGVSDAATGPTDAIFLKPNVRCDGKPSFFTSSSIVFFTWTTCFFFSDKESLRSGYDPSNIQCLYKVGVNNRIHGSLSLAASWFPVPSGTSFLGLVSPAQQRLSMWWISF